MGSQRVGHNWATALNWKIGRFPTWFNGKEFACQYRRHRRHRWARAPGGRKWQPTPYSCLENSMDRGAWQATAHGVTESDTIEHTCKNDHNSINSQLRCHFFTAVFSEILSSVQSFSRVQFFATPWIAARQASLSITHSRSSLRRTSIESVMPSSHLILCCPLLLLPPIPPSTESFPMSQHFAWGGQSIGVSVSASFPPKTTQGWSPLEWAGWISLQSKGLSRVFSNTTVQKHQFFGAQLSSQSNTHIYTWTQEKP